MNTFTARVELQSANPDDYKKLYSEMLKEALVASGDKAESGNVEFKSKDKISIREVIDAVVRAASKTGNKSNSDGYISFLHIYSSKHLPFN